MSNLVAYIPVLNDRHRKWFRKHADSTLYLIFQTTAEELIPRLVRNIGALDTDFMCEMVRFSKHLLMLKHVEVLEPRLLVFDDDIVIMPDEDVSHALAEKFLIPAGCRVQFEMIWARWDMTAVKLSSPVMEDVDVITGHTGRLAVAKAISSKSPDWWRQVGAALFVGGSCVASACNMHYPNEYAADIMGDPRLNVDAGQPGKYLSLHAERAVIAGAARDGVSTRGGLLYVTTFPCEDCAREIVAAGIDLVFFEEGYSALNAQEIFRAHGVKIVRIQHDPVSA